LRDGHRLTVPARELVPGDIVYLESGNFVPADVRLLEAVNLRIEEAALTGESVAVEKSACGRLESDIPIGDRKNTAFMGTTVTYGRGRGVVVSTGMWTQLGLIAGMLQSVDEEETPLQQRLEHLGKLLGYGALAICGLVFLVGILRAEAINAETITEMFMIAVSLAIAAVPEGLPAVVTISLALGMREMIRRNALIRKLASVETLGSATVICSDKTGTLTQNEMTVTRMWVDGQNFSISGSGYATRGDFILNGKAVDLHQYPGLLSALWIGVLNNDAILEPAGRDEPENKGYRMVGDPTEGSLLIAAAKAGIYATDLSGCFPREEEIPFDSTRKRMVTIHEVLQVDAADVSPIYDDDQRQWHIVAVKGAPDVVLDLCNRYDAIDDRATPLDDEARQRILAANDAMTCDALRVLGLAYRLVPVLPEEINNEEMERDLIFVGLAGMIDPARPEVNPALDKARKAGIRTIMITGDYPNTAMAIADSIGLLNPAHKVLTGSMLNEMDDIATASSCFYNRCVCPRITLT
jgi:P-type Ca2+ transporter type 2C